MSAEGRRQAGEAARSEKGRRPNGLQERSGWGVAYKEANTAARRRSARGHGIEDRRKMVTEKSTKRGKNRGEEVMQVKGRSNLQSRGRSARETRFCAG